MSKILVLVAHGVRLSAVALGLAFAQGTAVASPFLTDKPYDLTVNVGGTYNSATDTIIGGTQPSPLGLTTVEDLFNKTTGGGLTQVNSGYTDQTAAVIRFGYRGLPIVLITSINSPGIQLLIPGLNERQPFNAQTTRDGNVDDLETYLKNSGGDILNRLQQLLAKTSPIDPIAGNPSSMQSRMVSEDFDRNFTQFASNIKDGGPAAGESVNNLIGIGMSYANYSQGGLSSSVVTLPLSYTSRSDLDPRRQLTFYVPITVSEVAGAKSYGVNLGVAYRIPVNDEWALTPAVGYGISGSVDLGSAAAMMAASLTSQYTIRRDGYDLAIGNMVGMYQSSKFKVGDYSFDPKISNTVLRNGIMASIPTMVMGKKMAVEISFVNTLYSGTDLYSNQYNEIGVTLGTNKNANSARSYLRAGMTYLQGQNDIKGFRLNVGYWF
jgi:hypothetical protein